MAWHDIALGVALAMLGAALRGEVRRRRVRAHFRRAGQAERDAAVLLRRHGYRIIAVQPEHRIRFRLGGRQLSSTIRADYLVRRYWTTYVVEVKSGDRAPDPSCRATRRQLREYCAVFPHPVLLVDAAAGTVLRVDFIDGSPSRRLASSALRFLICLAAWWLASALVA